MHATEFPWIADRRLLQSLTSLDRPPNLLVVCAGVPATNVIESFRDWCRPPAHVCRLPGALRLPAIARGTLFLENVTAMTLAQQIAFGDWLDGTSGEPQIVSVAPASVWAAVQAGEFLEGLYYRLNTIVVEATAPESRFSRTKERRCR